MFHTDRMSMTRQPKGRAAQSNRDGRYLRHTREAIADGWDLEEELPPLRTELRLENLRKAITRNSSPDIDFDRAVTPYRGCEHGCIYCYARPSHAWLDMSPGLDFETKIIARPNAPDLLARELSKPGYKPAPMALGTVSDPYQPTEKDQKITRHLLEILWEFRHPVAIITRGSLIERDLDILGPMAAEGLVQVGVSLVTMDARLSRQMEPRAPAPARRLAMIRALRAAGVPLRAQVAPVIPGLTDHEMEQIVHAAHEAGAEGAIMLLVRLPLEVSELFQEWLRLNVPDRAEKILRRLRELHGGQLYSAEFGRRFRGQGPWADLLQARFRRVLSELGMAQGERQLDCTKFRVPPRPGDQLSLF